MADQPSKFRKKPVVIEAFQMTRERRFDNRDWPVWLHAAWNGVRDAVGTLQIVEWIPGGEHLEVVTPNGAAAVCFGDWILRGVKGELYPCAPDIFEMTYEPVTDDAKAATPQPAQDTCAKAVERDEADRMLDEAGVPAGSFLGRLSKLLSQPERNPNPLVGFPAVWAPPGWERTESWRGEGDGNGC